MNHHQIITTDIFRRLGVTQEGYFGGAKVALFVVDMTKPESFTEACTWKQSMSHKPPAFLVVNKIDLVPEGQPWPITKERLDLMCKTEGFLTWFPTSAKESKRVCVLLWSLINL